VAGSFLAIIIIIIIIVVIVGHTAVILDVDPLGVKESAERHRSNTKYSRPLSLLVLTKLGVSTARRIVSADSSFSVFYILRFSE